MSVLVLGLVAAALTIASFLAQTYKILRTRDVHSLSAPMWVLSTIAFAVWVAYGVAMSAWPIVIPNAVCFALACFILVLKLLPTHKREAVADKLDPAA